MVKVAVVVLPATVTVAGRVAVDVLLLLRVITAPAAGAGPFRVSVPVEDLLPTTEVGFKERDESAAARTVRSAFRVVPL